MQYRKFGNTELLVSEVGFGAWAIGGGVMIGDTAIGWGKTDDRISIDAIHAAMDAGINFFDTADIYGFGHSEELLGKTIGSKREMLIASKCGNVARNGKFTVDYSPAHILKACEDSLRRLKRNEIDLYQLHSARSPHLTDGECMETMELLQKQGKIRYWGLSLNSFDPAPEAMFLLEKEKGIGFQLVLNLLNQRSLPLLPAAKEKGFGIIARMPLQFGLLTGKFDRDITFEANDHRKKRLPPELVAACAAALAPVWRLCKKYDCSKAELALSYVLSHADISLVIPGMRKREQVNQNTTRWIRLEEADRIYLEELGRKEFIPVMSLLEQQG